MMALTLRIPACQNFVRRPVLILKVTHRRQKAMESKCKTEFLLLF
jgi:hypothetical protein